MEENEELNNQEQHDLLLMEGACCMCGGVDNEDLIILCDRPGCRRETHIYCLWPPLDKIPEGEWLCDLCSPCGSSTDLEHFLQRTYTHRTSLELLSPMDYSIYIDSLSFPLELWNPLDVPPPHEFDISDFSLLGSKVRSLTP